ATSKSDLDRFGANELSRSHDQLGAAGFVIGKMHFDEVMHHLASAFAHPPHVDPAIVFANPEFFAPPDIGGDLRAVDDILAREAGDVRARTADILSLDHGSLHPLFRQ